MSSPNHNGKLVIISGPSGVGKSTICRKIVERFDNVSLSVSATTRPKADAEIEGREYYFLTEEEFKKRIENGEFLEYANVFGNLYGTLKEKVDEQLAADKTVILEIDVQGGRQVKEKCPEALMIFIMPPTQKHLAERMNDRGREDERTAKKRLEGANVEIAAAWQHYNNMVINDDLAQAVGEVAQIMGLTKEQK
jgi:guanylate kinase